MTRPTHSSQLDTEGLQADVMRFMAIIAFCLIAILALVKNIEAPPPELPMKPVARPNPGVAAVRQAEETVTHPAPHRLVPVPVPAVSEQIPQKTAQAPPKTRQDPLPQYKAPALPRVKATQTARAKAVHPPKDPEFVSLRFASDDAFLHLIAAGEIQLYAQADRRFVVMTEDFGTAPVKPSGELYALMPESIPARIVSLFEREVAVTEYLVALSPKTRRDLQQRISAITAADGSAAGTIVIHRNGQVSHEI
jgi:hypothetical protein